MIKQKFFIKQLSKEYLIKKLNHKDIPKILELSKTNPLYYKHNPPKPTHITIMKDMTELPPNATKKDKKYIGFFKKKELVAIMDLILNYPNKNTCFIGLFMMHQKYQNQGIGTQIIQNCLSYLKQFYKTARLGYISSNKQSQNFWLKNGFYLTGEEYQHPKNLIKVMEKDF